MEGGGLAVDRQQCRAGRWQPQRPGQASLQGVVKEGRAKLKTVRGTEKVADHLKKPKSKVEIEELLKKVGAEFEE